MKLTDVELEEGRALVRAGDGVGLEAWIHRRGILINKEVLRDTMLRTMQGDPDRAIKLFDRVFPGMDPEFDRSALKARLTIRLLVFLFVTAGLMGGVVYLVRSLFW